jgi:hypothetical protein
MASDSFDYQLVLTDDETSATSIIAYQETVSDGLRGVLWSVPRRQWIYAPAIVSDLVYDDSDPVPTRTADRTTAERVARDELGTDLPSEEALTALCAEGEQMGWRFGPPRHSATQG